MADSTEEVKPAGGLRRKEAAIALGVSLRTLDSYRAEGRLSVQVCKGERGPDVVYFDPEEIAQLATERDAKITQRRNRIREQSRLRARQSEERKLRLTLSPYHLERLKAEAGEAGMKTQDYARSLLRDGTLKELQRIIGEQETETRELRQEIAQLKTALRSERKTMAEAFAVALEFSGLKREDARAWVNRNLLSEEKRGK